MAAWGAWKDNGWTDSESPRKEHGWNDSNSPRKERSEHTEKWKDSKDNEAYVPKGRGGNAKGWRPNVPRSAAAISDPMPEMRMIANGTIRRCHN